MSDLNVIVQAISTVGFPIACCCYLLWQSNKQTQYHQQEQEKLRDCLNKNTESIAKLADKIDEIMK